MCPFVDRGGFRERHETVEVLRYLRAPVLLGGRESLGLQLAQVRRRTIFRLGLHYALRGKQLRSEIFK
jgi:hypothetical protein